ncbi:MAG: methylated-DNA--[protein]-cysteine S-methyltransferase [Sulfurimonas sp.]
MTKSSRIISTPIGDMLAVANEDALIYLDFIDKIEEVENSDNHILVKLEQELKEYFSKKLQTFSIPLSPSGTEFQKGVWDTLLKIPYASTLSYAGEAKLFGNPKATRAVANANGKNPISILIPCHRVISSDGSIGGYGGGVYRKEFLLSLEGVEI